MFILIEIWGSSGAAEATDKGSVNYAGIQYLFLIVCINIINLLTYSFNTVQQHGCSYYLTIYNVSRKYIFTYVIEYWQSVFYGLFYDSFNRAWCCDLWALYKLFPHLIQQIDKILAFWFFFFLSRTQSGATASIKGKCFFLLYTIAYIIL